MKCVKFEKIIGIALIALLVGFASITKVFAGMLERGPAKLRTAHDKNTNNDEVSREGGSRCNC